MLSLTPRRLVLAAVATIGLVAFAGILLCSSGFSDPTEVAVIGPAGSLAEGVENEETAHRLRELGCDAVQGNFFCYPLPARDIPEVPSHLALIAQ